MGAAAALGLGGAVAGAKAGEPIGRSLGGRLRACSFDVRFLFLHI